MPMAKLKTAVYVQDPSTREELILLPGESPDPEIAALITNPDAWETPPVSHESEGGPAAVEEPDPTLVHAEAEPRPKEVREGADGGAAKKPPQRRSRSSAAA